MLEANKLREFKYCRLEMEVGRYVCVEASVALFVVL